MPPKIRGRLVSIPHLRISAILAPLRPATAPGAHLAVTLAALLSGAIPTLAGAEEWALLAHEGGCFPIQSLKRRLPDLPAVGDLEAFQTYIQSKGWTFVRKPHSLPSGKAVEFAVESQGLALLFVTRELCATAPESAHR